MNAPLPTPLYKLPSSLGEVMLEYKAHTSLQVSDVIVYCKIIHIRNVCVSNLHVRSCAVGNCQRASISKTYDDAVDYDDSYVLLLEHN